MWPVRRAIRRDHQHAAGASHITSASASARQRAEVAQACAMVGPVRSGAPTCRPATHPVERMRLRDGGAQHPVVDRCRIDVAVGERASGHPCRELDCVQMRERTLPAGERRAPVAPYGMQASVIEGPPGGNGIRIGFRDKSCGLHRPSGRAGQRYSAIRSILVNVADSVVTSTSPPCQCQLHFVTTPYPQCSSSGKGRHDAAAVCHSPSSFPWWNGAGRRLTCRRSHDRGARR